MLVGNDGNDTLIGGTETDTLIGGAGDDIYVGDVVTENPGEGLDTVQSSVSYTLGANLENLTLTGTAAVTGTGNELDNVVIGSSAANLLSGLAGADTLYGGVGIDTASYIASASGVTVNLATGHGFGGDAEGDTLANIENLTGSAFNDMLEGNDGNNALVGGLGIDTVSYEHAAGGITVSLALTTAQATGGSGIDTLSGLENLTGSALDDVLTGSSLGNLLVGGAGNDTLDGGARADTLIGGAGDDVLDGGIGTDLADYSDQTTAVSVTLASPANATMTANGVAEDTVRNIENVQGGSGNDALVGDGLANSLFGGNGNDLLNGGAGKDLLVEGNGNDQFVFNTSLNASTNVDTIIDFNVAEDTIKLENAVFTAVTGVGTLTVAQFVATSSGVALDADDRFIYRIDTGKLFYDSNGNMAGAAPSLPHCRPDST